MPLQTWSRWGRTSPFDLVLFHASLEHMTPRERMAAISGTWDMLAPGALWALAEAPNRLWYFDQHTSQLPFFNWLPDELAFQYSRRSPRPLFRDKFREPSEESMESFFRWGRGVSFHELELALERPAEELHVVSSMFDYSRKASPLAWAAWRVSKARQFGRFLHDQKPELHPGFFEPSLFLVLRKD